MNTPIIDAVTSYIRENNVPFSMPGHKIGRAFNIEINGMKLSDIFLAGDLTEVDGLDNLNKPEGAIKESLELLAKCYKAEKSYFLVNGSTSGNMAMIFSSFNEGDKVLVDRGCHKSVFNSVIMRKLRPIYINSKVDKELNIPLSVAREDVETIIEKERDIKGIIITYPTYYGITCDLKSIIKTCKKRGLKVIVDCAHGAHFGFNDKLPENPISLGADMAVVSAHKTLPSLTQTAYLNVGSNVDIELLEFYIKAFSTTSPSYIFMMSLDFARSYMSERGKEEYDKLIERCNWLKEKVRALKLFKILDNDDLTSPFSIDPTRIIINCKKGYSGHLLLEYLRKNNIQCEMSDNSNVVLIPSVFSNSEDFKKLYKALEICTPQDIKRNEPIIAEGIIGEFCMDPYKVMGCKKKKIKFYQSEGSVSSAIITPYPPGIPIIVMGEKILKSQIELIRYYLKSGISILGIDDEYIEILDME